MYTVQSEVFAKNADAIKTLYTNADEMVKEAQLLSESQSPLLKALVPKFIEVLDSLIQDVHAKLGRAWCDERELRGRYNTYYGNPQISTFDFNVSKKDLKVCESAILSYFDKYRVDGRSENFEGFHLFDKGR